MDDLDRLADDMEAAGDRLGRDAHTLVKSSTLRTEELGAGFAPVLTGALKASISSDFEGDAGSDRIMGETGPDIHYDRYVHNGTSRQAPQPFMDEAADITEPPFYAVAEVIAERAVPGG